MTTSRQSTSGADDRRLDELHLAIRKCNTLYNSFDDDEYEDAPEQVRDLIDTCNNVRTALNDVRWVFEQLIDIHPKPSEIGHKLDECSAFIEDYHTIKQAYLISIREHATPSRRVRVGWQRLWREVRWKERALAVELKDSLMLEIVKLVRFVLVFGLKRTIPRNPPGPPGRQALPTSSTSRPGSSADMFDKIRFVQASHGQEMRLASSEQRSPSVAKHYRELESVWHKLCVRVGLAVENGPAYPLPRERLLEAPPQIVDELLSDLADLPAQSNGIPPPRRKPVAIHSASKSSSNNSQGTSISESSTPKTTPSPLAPPPSHKPANSINLGDPVIPTDQVIPTEIATISLSIHGKGPPLRLQSWKSQITADSQIILWTGVNPKETLEHRVPPNTYPLTWHQHQGDQREVTFHESHHLVFKSDDDRQHDYTEAATYVFLSPEMRTEFLGLIRGKYLIETFHFEYLWSQRCPRKEAGEAVLGVLKLWQDRQSSNRHTISFYVPEEKQEREIPVLSFKQEVRKEVKLPKVAFLDFDRRRESTSRPAPPQRRKSTFPFTHKKTTPPKRKSVSSDSSSGNSDISEIFKYIAIEFKTPAEADNFKMYFEQVHREDYNIRSSGTQEPSAEPDELPAPVVLSPVRMVDQPDSNVPPPNLPRRLTSPLPLSDNSPGPPKSPVRLGLSPTSMSPDISPNPGRSTDRAPRTVVARQQAHFSDTGIVNAVKLLAPRSLDNKYVYTPLKDPNEIRLLVIRPAKNLSDSVYCKIITSLNAPIPPIPYEALSYTWGVDVEEEEIQVLYRQKSTSASADQKRSIVPPGKFWAKLYVRKNLHAAIRRLRHEQEEVVFWIDALCIDQENIAEKNAQVRMMAEIYRRATNVCIWLGEGSNESERALEFIPDLLQGSNLDKFLKDRSSSGSWLALVDLMRNRWFSRRWVVQEVALANKPTLHYGDKSLAWADFAHAVEVFVGNSHTINSLMRKSQHSRHPSNPLGNVKTGAHVLVEALDNLFRRTEDKDVHPLSTLETLVSTLLSFEASDPRDTIYAVLSLAKDTIQGNVSRSFHQDAPSIVPDYEKPVIDVFKEFVDFAVSSSESLDIICRHWAPELQQKDYDKLPNASQLVPTSTRLLPSWIPPVSGSAYGTPVQRLTGRMNGDSFVGLPNRKNYNATPKTKPIWRFGKVWEPSQREAKKLIGQNPETNAFNIYEASPESRDRRNKGKHPERERPIEGKYQCDGSMFVTGFRLGVIDDISSRISQGISIPRESLALGGYEVPDHTPAIPAVPDEVWRTMVADRGSEGQPAPSVYQRGCEKCLARSTKGDIYINELILADDDQMMVDFLKRVQSVVWNRKFLRSAAHVYDAKTRKFPRRRLFGLGPAEAANGDIICILLGCSVPVILREFDTPRHYFELVGEAYIYGMMDGEALGERKLDQILEQCEEFELR